MNKRMKNGAAADRRIAAAVCLAAAVLLLAAALQQPKHKPAEGWVALNGEVEAALAHWDEERAAAAAGEKEGDGAAAKEAKADEKETAGAIAGHVEQAELAGDNERQTEPSSASVPESSYYMGKLDINRASADEFVSLPGIGPAKARAIVEERERSGFFKSADDLLRVRGIGEKILEGLKDSIVVRP